MVVNPYAALPDLSQQTFCPTHPDPVALTLKLRGVNIIGQHFLQLVLCGIPIAPGGAGVPELLYIAGLTAIAPGYEAEITAGVFLFRLYVWFLPIPIAWILLKIVRRGRSMLPTTAELRTYAAAGT